MKKKLLISLGILLVLLLGLALGLQGWLRGWVNRERLVGEMEKGWNCRAELASTSLNIFTSPATVDLHGLQLAPRDDEVPKPLKQRTPFDHSKALLTADRITLDVTLSDLLRRTAHIRRLRIDGFTLRDEMGEDGWGLLDEMFTNPNDLEEDEEQTSQTGPRSWPQLRAPFDPPAWRGSSVLAPAAENAASDPQAKSGGDDADHPKHWKMRRKRKDHEHKPFKASDLRLALEAEEASVEHARVDLRDLGHHTRTLMEDVHLALKQLDVAPDDLAHHNTCNLELGGTIRVEKTEPDRPTDVMVNCDIEGGGRIKPFDVDNGEWNPDLSMAVTVRKGSNLGGSPLKNQMKEKDAKNLAEWGIDLGDVVLGGVLGEDATTSVHIANHKTIIKQDTRLVFPQYEITLDEGSWFNAHEDIHIMRCTLLISADLSAKILDQVKKSVSAKYGNSIGGLAVSAVGQVLLDDKKRLEIKVKSKGKISKPVIDWDNPLSDVKNLLKDAGSSLINDLLGK